MGWATKNNKDFNIWDRIGMALYGAGGGDVPSVLLKQKEAEQAMTQWQAEQQMKAATANLVPSPNGEYVVGNQRYSRKPMVMPDLSKWGLGGGMGLTGATIDPSSGEVKLNIGQTPENKQQLEDKQRRQKESDTSTQSWKGGKAFLNIIKNKFLETKPPNTGMLGINKSGILPQPLYGMQQKVGSLLQWTDNQKKDNLYVSYVNALKSRLAKGGIVGTDVGNLSVQEQQWVMEGIPGLMDYKDVGLGKIDNLLGMLDAMYEARKLGYANLDVMLTDKGQNYFKGQVITKGNKSYKVVGGDLVNDPDIEVIK
jgi:hypothetical protein